MKKLCCLIIGLLTFYLLANWQAGPVLAGPPDDFEDSLVTLIPKPTAMAFTPEGRLLITTQSGQLRVYQDGTLLETPALDLSSKICDQSERGLLGVAVDPDFATNHYIYLYYTFKKFGVCPIGNLSSIHPVNRVSRFFLPDTNVINPASEVVLVDNIITVYGYHNGGDLHFGPDELLYISLGDGGDGELAKNLGKLAGKMIRVGRDGAIPITNPYATTPGSRRCGHPAGVPGGSGPCQEVIAYGLRNPFRFAFKPGTNRFYINDVGQDEWEEIDEWSGGSGAPHYGWPVREGPCGRYDNPDHCTPNPSGLTAPIFYYNHNTNTNLLTDGCSAITGGTFVPVGVWSAAYEDSYLFSDLVCDKIFLLKPNGLGHFTLSEFATELLGRRIISMIFGPYNETQALYYATYQGSGGSQIRRIAYNGGNQDPVAAITAQPDYGSVPLSVTFSASGSSDPDNDPITFDWNFGNGAILSETSSPAVTHTYLVKGVYTATLVVRDHRGGTSLPAAVRIDVGNTPPIPTITFPLAENRFYVGQLLTLQGLASDLEDGPLPASALTWEVTLHHLDQEHPDTAHTHPLLLPTSGNNIPIVAPHPEGLRAAALSYLEIKLTASDSLGRTGSITQTLEPNRVNLSFATQPPGLKLIINNEPFTASRVWTSWQNYPLHVIAPLFQDYQGETWLFTSWSDYGPADHLILTPYTSLTYTAVFTPISATKIWLPEIK